MIEVLLIDDAPERSKEIAALLRDMGVSVTAVDHYPDTPLSSFDCMLALDTYVLPRLSDISDEVQVIVLTESGAVKDSVSALQRGAKDYLQLPATAEEIAAAVERATTLSQQQHASSLRQLQMIGSSESMQSLRSRIAKVAPTNSSVLIVGQSGTGKELVARAIHASSKRSQGPLMTLNCATVPADLIEAELFGVEPNGPHSLGSHGLIEAANGGTLFLDEIAELPPAAQARLLQVVDGRNRRIGAASANTVNVRIVAATHKDLDNLIEEGLFRSDLYYRLNVFSFHLSPLRNRHQDILEIGEWLLLQTTRRLNKQNLVLGEEARRAMLAYHWPGNVRELSNAIERAVILADDGSMITPNLLAINATLTEPTDGEIIVDQSETSLEDYFVRFVTDHQDELTETELADKLGISRKSLWERRQRLNIPRTKTRKRGPRRDVGAQ